MERNKLLLAGFILVAFGIFLYFVNLSAEKKPATAPSAAPEAAKELIVTPRGEKATRVYAGGTLTKEELEKMGLTKKDVIGKLVLFVNQLGDKTRLDEEAEVFEGDWKYTYKVMKVVEEIPVSVGEEEIRYNDKLVFVHYHIISPVK